MWMQNPITSWRCGMARFIAAALAAMMFILPATAEEVIIIDAPDVKRLRNVDEGFRTSEVTGMTVIGNAGREIGEIDDFVIARGGYLYAIVALEQGMLEAIRDLGADEHIVVPWNQLRKTRR